MEQLKHDIVITIPSEVIETHKDDLPDGITDKLTMKVYYIGDDYDNDMDWERYRIEPVEINDPFVIRICKYAMDTSREIEKNGGGPVEEFIYQMIMKSINQEEYETDLYDLLSDISD